MVWMRFDNPNAAWAHINYRDLSVTGWAISEGGMERVEVYLDGNFVRNGSYGPPRPDVEKSVFWVKEQRSAGFRVSPGMHRSTIIGHPVRHIHAALCMHVIWSFRAWAGVLLPWRSISQWLL